LSNNNPADYKIFEQKGAGYKLPVSLSASGAESKEKYKYRFYENSPDKKKQESQ